VPDHPLFALEDELRRALAARGLFEAHTPAFAPEGEGDVEVRNPLSATERHLRGLLTPALLRRLEYNLARGNRDVRLFEIGTAFRAAGKGEPPRETTQLAAVLTGLRAPSHWSAPDEAISLWDVKSLLEDVARRVHGEAAAVAPGAALAGAALAPSAADEARLDPAASFTVTLPDGTVVGAAGRVPEGVVDKPLWAGDVRALEVVLPAEVGPRTPPAYVRPPSLPPIDRDLALIVPNGVAAATVADALRGAAGSLLTSLDLFDVYEGKGIPEGTRSLAFRLRFRAAERTLKDEEVDAALRAALVRLEEELGVQPR
jgi:phenylalanyl-tRNA synthetase beta chain